MKTIIAISIMAILATGVIAPALQDAYALKADTSKKLSPKAFGDKTKTKMSMESPKAHKTGFEVKKEQSKDFKKLIVADNAKQMIKNIWRVG